MRSFASLALITLGAASCSAFMVPVARPRDAAVMMAAGRAPSRREALREAFGGLGLLGLGLAMSSAAPANAGWLNSDSLPEVIKPKDAVIDEEILSSSDVQNELKNVKQYREKVLGLKQALSGDSQVDLSGKIKDTIDYSALRDSLNKINSVFSEDTQRGTDRLVRLILQDVNELEAASRKRPGVDRSDKRVGQISKKLVKLEGAFDEILSYF